jgi:hypothetical protein
MKLLRLLFSIAALSTLLPFSSALYADVTFDLKTAKLLLNQKGRVSSLTFADGKASPAAGETNFRIHLDKGASLIPESIVRKGNELHVAYTGAWSMVFKIEEHNGFVLFELTQSKLPENTVELDLFHIALPEDAKIASVLNAGLTDSTAVALMAAEPNIQAFAKSPRSFQANRQGCSHQFTQSDQAAKLGNFGARFGATNSSESGGWVMRGRYNPDPINLAGVKSIKAWVRGDGQGQLLKIQLLDSSGGHRDDYIKIDFTGWKPFTLSKASSDTLDYENITNLNLYYNGLPPEKTVSCDIDQIEAVIEKNGKEELVVLEDFEQPNLPQWISSHHSLNLKTYARYGLTPLRFALLASSKDDFLNTVERFEEAAGLPSPKFENTWLRESPLIRKSYFFVTNFKPSEFDEIVKLAKQGGFETILLGQSSWCHGTGHYETNPKLYPEGLPGLIKIVQRFKDAGFKVGFHVLGASLYPPDKYITPVPDKRLVKDADIVLAANIDDKTDFIPTLSPPSDFPATDAGYEGNGTDLQIGDELIRYTSLSLEAPFGFKGCRRGQIDTNASAHPKGATIHHLNRSFGYLMYDMDSTLQDEVTTNFARVANACGVDMVYFDGSERLQGEHWYYNARLIKSFYDKLDNKNTLLQASSMSHYSWHLLARMASADGHDDLKAYLDERSSSFASLYRLGIPLDIGWYYGYDPNTTPDMFEYILGATIGYDSSMSFQVSNDAAATNPFTQDYLALINRFERLRLSGRVDEAMRQRLHIDPLLGGLKPDEERAKLLPHRREYRLLGDEGSEIFQRVMYDPWRLVNKLDDQANQWSTTVEEDTAKIGVQFHALPGEWLQAGASWSSPKAVLLETFDNLAPYLRKADGKTQSDVVQHGEGGSTSKGTTQSLRLLSDNAPDGKSYALYEASNPNPTADGWSVMQRSFPAAIDLSQHKGIGLWMRGDAKGGSFKLQFLDGKNALDFYLPNDYSGWRYQQLPWPDQAKIDFSQIRTLGIYYNGIPGNSTVACGIDGIKAIPNIDQASIVNPYVEIGGQRIEWQGKLKQGEYLMLWPGEAVKHYQQDHSKPVTTSTIAPLMRLPKGPQEIRFGCQDGLETSLRVRITRQPAEQYKVPAG